LKSGPKGKRQWLERLRDEGIYLIDLAAVPVNSHVAIERATILKANIDATVALASELQPEGIVLIKKNVFGLLEGPLHAAGLPLLHEFMIPFPGSGQQKRFRERFAAAISHSRA
jgi:hypothetical protein